MSKAWKRKKCDTCDFSITDMCRRLPPSVYKANSYSDYHKITAYPIVQNEKACAEYRERN